jgi:hypothetical protein
MIMTVTLFLCVTVFYYLIIGEFITVGLTQLLAGPHHELHSNPDISYNL